MWILDLLFGEFFWGVAVRIGSQWGGCDFCLGGGCVDALCPRRLRATGVGKKGWLVGVLFAGVEGFMIFWKMLLFFDLCFSWGNLNLFLGESRACSLASAGWTALAGLPKASPLQRTDQRVLVF